MILLKPLSKTLYFQPSLSRSYKRYLKILYDTLQILDIYGPFRRLEMKTQTRLPSFTAGTMFHNP